MSVSRPGLPNRRPPVEGDASDILKRLRQCLPHLQSRMQPGARIFQLGLDSLDLVELLCVIEAEFDVQVSDREFDRMRTLGELAECVASRIAAKEAAR